MEQVDDNDASSQQEMTDPPIEKKLGEPMVILRDVAKYYTLEGRADQVKALDGVTLSANSEFYPIRKGEFVMLRGPSGGGKTTMLNLIGTIDRSTRGTVELMGVPITDASKDNFLASLRLARIGFVFQTFNLLATMSAFENVELPMTILGRLTAKERKARAMELLTLVGLRDRAAHLPGEMSGGEQQRVTIARALVNDPDILLLDEATGDLDTMNTIKIMDLLLAINLKMGKTMLMVTHNPDLEGYADRILYIRNGRLVEQALNQRQTPLVFSEYIKYLNSLETGELKI